MNSSSLERNGYRRQNGVSLQVFTLSYSARMHCEGFAIGVEKELGSNDPLGEGCLFQVSCSSNSFTSCKSFVSNPSVNQP